MVTDLEMWQKVASRYTLFLLKPNGHHISCCPKCSTQWCLLQCPKVPSSPHWHCSALGMPVVLTAVPNALWANHLKGWCIFWNWPLSGLQGVEVCAGLLQSVPMGAAECVQGYRVCAGCSFNILPCSSRLNQKIFYWKKKYFIWMCIKTKIIWKIDYFEDSI